MGVILNLELHFGGGWDEILKLLIFVANAPDGEPIYIQSRNRECFLLWIII